MLFHNHQTKLRLSFLVLALVALGGFSAGAAAQEYTVTLAFYEGLNLDLAEVATTPAAISVVFCGAAGEPLSPAVDADLWAFPDAVDLFLPYHPRPDEALWLAPGDGVQVVLLPDTPLDLVTLGDLDETAWQQPDALSVPTGATLTALGADPVTDLAVDAVRRRVFVRQDQAGAPVIRIYDLLQQRFWDER
jgi:hypothetical protein